MFEGGKGASRPRERAPDGFSVAHDLLQADRVVPGAHRVAQEALRQEVGVVARELGEGGRL